MTWYAIYQTSDGALRSEGSTPAEKTVDQLASEGLAQKSWETDRPANEWNAATQEYDIPRAVRKEPITPVEFRRRFTLPERQAIKTVRENDAIVDDFMDELAMAQSVDLDDAGTLAALDYLVGIGVINLQRRGEIIV